MLNLKNKEIMKAKNFLIMVVIIMTVSVTNSFGQSAIKLVKELNKGRKTELALVEKRYAKNFDTDASEKKEKEMAEVNARYDKLVETALSQQAEKVEQPQIEKRTRKFLGGANVEIQGDQGTFSGRTPNIERGANAYATVVVADANATLIKSLSGNGTVSAGSIKSTGFEGIVANRYVYGNRDITIIIEGTNSGNRYRKSFLLRPGQQISEHLLPGTYKATIKDGNYQDRITTFAVATRQNLTNSYEGKEVFWYVYGGAR